MSDVMFEVPSDDSIRTVIVDKKCIVNGESPKIIHEEKEIEQPEIPELLEADGTQG